MEAASPIRITLANQFRGRQTLCRWRGSAGDLAEYLAAAKKIVARSADALFVAIPTILENREGEIDFHDLSTADALLLRDGDAGLPVEEMHAEAGRQTAQLRDAGCLDLFENVEMPLATHLARMRERGLTVDKKRLHDLRIRAVADCVDAEKTLRELAPGRKINVFSHAQCVEALRNGPADGLADAMTAVRRAAMMTRIIDDIVDRAEYSPQIRTHFKQMGANTGRIVSHRPNLQGVPKHSEMGRAIRSCLMAGKGQAFVSADYSQIELRILASLSGDERMTDAFLTGRDIHAETAANVYSSSTDAVTDEQRQAAKSINFAIVYGAGNRALSDRLGVPVAEAERLRRAFHEKFPGVLRFQRTVEEQFDKAGFVVTPAGRLIAPKARYASLNAAIQGTGADILKKALLTVATDGELAVLSAVPVMTVHDEIVMQCPAQHAEAVGERMRAIMAGAAALSVPLQVDVASAETLGGCHDGGGDQKARWRATDSGATGVAGFMRSV